MKEWHANQKTIPPQETQPANGLPKHNENTDGETEEQVIQQIGIMLTQVSYFVSFATYVQQVAQSNLDTPVTEEALSFALWVMANHITSMCDPLKTLIRTLKPSPQTSLNSFESVAAVNAMEMLVTDIMNDVYGEYETR